jgi:hypothetical protein
MSESLARTAWDDLAAAHAVLESLHSGAAVLLPQLLDALTDSATDHPGHLQRVTTWRTAALAFLTQHEDVLVDLEQAIADLEPPDDAKL